MIIHDVHERVKEIRRQSREMRETNDCAVRAVAMATGFPYATVHGVMASFGRQPRRGTNTASVTMPTLRVLGAHVESARGIFYAKTIRGVQRQLPRNGSFLILVRKHILGVCEGVTDDWANGRQHHVRNIWRIDMVDEPSWRISELKKLQLA